MHGKKNKIAQPCKGETTQPEVGGLMDRRRVDLRASQVSQNRQSNGDEGLAAGGIIVSVIWFFGFGVFLWNKFFMEREEVAVGPTHKTYRSVQRLNNTATTTSKCSQLRGAE